MNTRITLFLGGALCATALIAGSCKESTPPPTVASVSVEPLSAGVQIGGTRQFTATLLDSEGDEIEGTIAWSVDDPGIASVSSTGLAQGIANGQTVIRATSGTKSGTAILTVTPTPQQCGTNDMCVTAQWTQATQALDGSIPMIRNGNGAAVNVIVTSTLATSVSSEIRIRVTNAGGTVLREETVPVVIPPNGAPTFASPLAQFLFQPSEIVPGMRWQVIRDPQGSAPDANRATDFFPRNAPQQLAVVDVPTLKMRFVPVVLTEHNNATGNVSAANLAEYTRMVESALPIGAFQPIVGPNFTSSQSFGTPPDQGGFATTFWQPVLIQLDLARVADPDPSAYWVGVVLPPPGFTRTNNGGIGYVANSGTSTGAGTRTNMVTSLGWASDPGFTRVTVAHELGHNFGRPHAPCGSADNSDPNFPYAGGLIGVPGHDVRGWMAGRAQTAVAFPPTSFDLMGYCTPMSQNWISDYNYRTILNFRTFTTPGGAVLRATEQPRTRVVLVSGIIDNVSDITLQPAFVVDARPTRPERDGPYTLEGRDRNGAVLFTRSFAPSVIAHAPNTGHFVFAIPVTPEQEASLAMIEVRGMAGFARIARPITAASLRAPGALAPTRSRGFVAVACEDANARAVIVRNAMGVMLGMATGSSAKVTADPGAQLEIVCSDGVGSSRRTVIAP